METPNLVGRSVAESDLPFVINVWNDPRVAPTVGGQQEVRI